MLNETFVNIANNQIKYNERQNYYNIHNKSINFNNFIYYQNFLISEILKYDINRNNLRVFFL